MGIYEDDYLFSSDEKNNKNDKKDKEKSLNPGTRIIYTAPNQSGKRKFIGFTNLDDEVDEPFEPASPEIKFAKKEEPKKSNTPVIEEEEISIDKPGYSKGFDYEAKMRKNNQIPRKTATENRTIRKAPSLEEEKRKRYEQAKRLEREQLTRQFIAMSKNEEKKQSTEIKKKPALDLDMEEIRLDDDESFYREAKKLSEKKSKGDLIRKIVLAVAIVTMLVSGTVLGYQLIQRQKGKDWEKEMSGLLISEPESTTQKAESKKKKDKNKKEETTEAVTEKVLTEEEQWEILKKEYPNVTFPEGLSLKYAKMYAINQDFVGYISIPEFGLGLPVVQSQKDTKTSNYYLRKNFYKEYSVYGCPFVPKTNDMENLDRNTVIYGHNNESNLAFAPLNKYKTLEGYKSAPVITFDTLYGKHKWKVFAAFIINTKADDDNGYIFYYTFTKMNEDSNFAEYIEALKERSLYDTGVDVLANDKILTLTTCSHEFDDARFVVVARLVRDGESETVNTSKAVANDSPRYPAAYYKAKKKKNPYKDAPLWYYPE